MFNEYYKEIISTIIVIVVLLLLRVFTSSVVKSYAKVTEINDHRTHLMVKYINIFVQVLAIICLFTIWGVKANQIYVVLSSAFAVIGVALFAQWSILSNITAGVILFFSFPFKIGDIIKIHDKDFPIQGEIYDIRAFHVYMRTAEGEFLTYPNNLLLQKGITIVTMQSDVREFTD